jgi:hypothetical protein
MSDKQRDKLLPYEYQLIDALGITKEEYLDFVAQQHIYSDAKAGSNLDARNDFVTISIVLTVIGMIFQVVAALLPEEQPAAQQQGGGVSASRDEIFAPRYGFDSQQQLAAYGDPINLIYTNTDTNSRGGVRVAGALLWSAVLSYGNSQLVRLVFALGAGGIGRLDENKSAFGQTPLRGLISQNYWVYFAPNYTGYLQYAHLRPTLRGVQVPDPTAVGTGAANPFLLRGTTDNPIEGFSHAYSPSAGSSFGIYGAIPINVDILIRNQNGDFESANNGVKLTINNVEGYSPRQIFSTTSTASLTLAAASAAGASLAEEEASDSRRILASVIDNSGLFKFGSTRFKVLSANRGDVAEGEMVVQLAVVNSGNVSSVPYSTTRRDGAGYTDPNLDTELSRARAAWEAVNPIVQALLAEDQRPEIASPQQLLSDGRIFEYKITSYEDRLVEREPSLRQTGYGRSATYQSYCSSGTLKSRTIGSGRGAYVSYYCEVSQSFPVYGYVLKRNLTNEEKNALTIYINNNNYVGENALANLNADLFFTKAFVRMEEASYQTLSKCNIVDFSIKARVFKRISGRQEEYGTGRKSSGYKSSENGIKYRTSMFIVRIKRPQDTAYTYAPAIFLIRRSADIDNYVFLRFHSGIHGANTAENWEFIFEPIYDVAAEVALHPELKNSNGQVVYCCLNNTGGVGSRQRLLFNSALYQLNTRFEFIGFIVAGGIFPPFNTQPKDLNEWDVFSNTSDSQVQFSFDNGPEMSLAAITEQISEPFSTFPKLYDNMALIGLNMYSGKAIQDLRSFSVFATQGRVSRLLRTSEDVNGIAWGQPGYQYLPDAPTGYANTAPDIFIDTVLDVEDGIGRHASIHSVDIEQLARSKKFCETNQLFMDCVIAEPSSWRQFWAQNAGYSLLELAKVGGQDTLIPAVPYNRTTGAIERQLTISALFNQGNIIEDSYKEEFIDYGETTQDMIVSVIYRNNDANNVFSTNTSVDVQFADTIESGASRKTVDMSNYVTRREQAILVGKLLCNSRRFSQRAIEFRTFPTDSPVFPGAYIYVELAHNQWDNIRTGIIEDGGFLNTPVANAVPNGTAYSMLIYNPDGGASGTQLFTNVTVENNRARTVLDPLAFQNYVGYLFVMGTVVTNKRIFRVNEVQMDEEGEVTVRAVHHETDGQGLSMISRGMGQVVPGLFLIDGRAE